VLGKNRFAPLDERLSSKSMKILFLSRWFPFPADNGSKLRIFNLLKITARSHQVDLVSFASEAVSDRRIEGLKPYCGKVRTVVFRDFNPRSLRLLLIRIKKSLQKSFGNSHYKLIMIWSWLQKSI
jgi:hypothetical protein